MEIMGNYDATAGIEDATSLVPVLRELDLDRENWTFSINAVIKGRSGLRHRFDFLISSLEEQNKFIVCMLLKEDSTETMVRITTFYAHSADVAASKAIIISEAEPPLEVRMLSNSLGIEIFTNGRKSSGHFGALNGRIAGENKKNSGSQARKKLKVSGERKKKYRDRTRIIHEILSSATGPEGATITRIIFKCNLNYRTAKEIVSDMLKKDLLSVRETEEAKRVYKITKTGSSILEKLYFYDSVNRNMVE